jgi:hypothetical protein
MMNDGALYMPTATATPPGIQVANVFADELPLELRKMRRMVVMAKSKAAPAAHSGTLSGRPWPVTRRAV